MTKNNLTVIIPIHEYNEQVELLTDKALCSLPESGLSVMIVAPKEVLDKLKTPVSSLDIVTVQNDGDTSFANQMNLGVSKCKTEYFSLLEFDDTYEQFFFDDLDKFLSDGDFSNSDVILPIVGFHNGNDEVLKLVNDASWTQGFAEERGVLNIESTSMYDVFIISGAVFKTKAYLEVGGIKDDMKIYFSKEILMRLIEFGFKVSVYPKLGYKHYVGRTDSLFDLMFKSKITRHENEFYNRKTIEEYKLNPNSEEYVKITYTAPEIQ